MDALVAIYVVVGFAWFVLSASAYTDVRESYRPADRREGKLFARLALSAPVWPLVLVVAAVHFIARMVRDAR